MRPEEAQQLSGHFRSKIEEARNLQMIWEMCSLFMRL